MINQRAVIAVLSPDFAIGYLEDVDHVRLVKQDKNYRCVLRLYLQQRIQIAERGTLWEKPAKSLCGQTTGWMACRKGPKTWS